MNEQIMIKKSSLKAFFFKALKCQDGVAIDFHIREVKRYSQYLQAGQFPHRNLEFTLLIFTVILFCYMLF